MSFPSKFLVDGIDRLGKSSLIKGIQEELGYHLVIHYDKPKLLENLIELAFDIQGREVSEVEYDDSYRNLTVRNLALKLFQEEANRVMFNLLKTDAPIIFDRTHLGEMVYAPLYRGYSGDYVLKMEQDLIDSKPFTSQEDIKLILLTSSNTQMLKDDGLSFNYKLKDEEQQMFVSAFNKSAIKNKIIIDVHNGEGGYRNFDEILKEALHKTS